MSLRALWLITLTPSKILANESYEVSKSYASSFVGEIFSLVIQKMGEIENVEKGERREDDGEA